MIPWSSASVSWPTSSSAFHDRDNVALVTSISSQDSLAMPRSMTLSRAARLFSKLFAETELLFTTGYRRVEDGHQRQRGSIVDSPLDHSDQSRAACYSSPLLLVCDLLRLQARLLRLAQRRLWRYFSDEPLGCRHSCRDFECTTAYSNRYVRCDHHTMLPLFSGCSRTACSCAFGETGSRLCLPCSHTAQ